MISVEKLSVDLGVKTLFENVSFLIRPHDRIGLIGANGSGKTTLLRVLVGDREPSRGAVRKANYVSVGYLPQEGVPVLGRTLLDEGMTAFDDVLALQARVEQAMHDLSTTDAASPEHAEQMEVLGELQHRLEESDVYRIQSKVEKVLMGLGFGTRDLERSTSEFSGGWQMRIALAKLLLRSPSLLMLDEPTNHLDSESIAWLEDYLRSYDGAVMIVSHDTVFLDRITSRTLALERDEIEDYAGSFSAYVEFASARREQLEREWKNQQAAVKRTERFIERFRYKATKARQVQSRVKQLAKVERIELDNDGEEIAFRFPDALPSGKVLVSLHDVSKSYGDLRVLQKVNVAIERGDRIAVLGPNGAGKSTLIRILAGVESYDEGERIPGHELTPSYYAQHQADELSPELDVLGVIDAVAQGEIRKRLRTILGSFLFHGDDVFKPVAVLSGGEKSRLALARMLLRPANLLVMDEPTNHLDIRSKAVLQDALGAYEGTTVIVSHDRGFLEPIVNRILEVTPGRIRLLHDSVSHYFKRREDERKAEAEGRRAGSSSAGAGLTEKERRRRIAEIRQEKSRELAPHRRRLESIEAGIESLEHEIGSLEHSLADPAFYQAGDGGRSAGYDLKAKRALLETTMAEWESLGKEIAWIEERFDKQIREVEGL
ncbi:MAG: ABC-F family ATP-binding cassette domain-containing protein [Bacteroidetes bacterium]|jgi:ATP-binding cassette subfamily F protein 3|nr:ABC-F family ATP-binding cassette domain-containing protein [Bacteroidota bacterium]